jgi:plasmid stabilization system protein ParE
MTVGRGFDLHPLAAQDIIDLWTFIANDSPQAARRVREDILDAIRALVPFPNQGHKRPDLTQRPLRFTVVHEYLICLRSRRETSVGDGSDARTAQPSRDGRDPQRQRVA